ncbi:MAG: DUF6326 family protein [Pseudomonadota bacterium]
MISHANKRAVISAVWVTVALNMAFADIISLYVPGAMQAALSGVIEGVEITNALLLMGGLLIQVPIAMVVITQLLPEDLLKSANMAAVIITTVFIVGGGSPKPVYILFASIEVAAMVLILWLAWRPIAPLSDTNLNERRP